MNAIYSALDLANSLLSYAAFLLLIALAIRGARRHRRWSLVLVAAAITLWILLIISQRLRMIWLRWLAAPVDTELPTEIHAETMQMLSIAGPLLAIGLALEIRALFRAEAEDLAAPRTPHSRGSAGGGP